jgi:hypothetical protein
MHLYDKALSFVRNQPLSWSSLRLGLIVGAVVYFTISTKEPSEELVINLARLVHFTGGAASLWFGLKAMIALFSANSATDAANRWFTYVHRAFSYIAASIVVGWVIGLVGDSVYHSVKESPELGAMLVAMVPILYVIEHLASGFSSQNSVGQSAKAAGQVALLARNTKLTSRDLSYIKVHEAGHVLIFAALDKIPANLSVSIKQRHDMESWLGRVTYGEILDRLDFQETLYWHMLLCLAGQEAERHTFSNLSAGSGSDYEKWHRLAKEYLSNHYRGIYYINTEDPWEAEHNTTAVRNLLSEQRKLLTAFFASNASILAKIAHLLGEQQRLTAKKLQQMFQGAQFPPQFPRPKSITFQGGYLPSPEEGQAAETLHEH